MDVLDWLNLVLADAELLRTPSEALTLLPDIASDGPAAAPLVIDGAPWRGFPAAFAEQLEKPVGEFVLARLQEYAAGGQEELADVSGERLIEDTLVQAVGRLLVESAPLGRRSSSLVLLETARQSSRLFSGETSQLRSNLPSLAQQIDRLHLAQDDAESRGSALSRFAWSLAARLSLAWTLAGRLDPRVQPSRLYQGLVQNRLALVASRGSIQLPRDLVLASRVAGGRAQASTLNATYAAVVVGIEKAMGGDTSDAARALRDLIGRGRDARSLATDPRLSAFALLSLSELVDKGELTQAGVAAAHAKSLLDTSSASALGAEYRRACETLRGWDLLTAVAGRCLPVKVMGGAATTPQGKLSEKRPWGLLSPRGVVATAHIVLVRRAEIDEAVSKKFEQHGAALFGALDRVWRELAEKAQGLGGVTSAERWLAAFPDKASADKFAVEAERAFRPPIRLDLSPLGPTVSLSRDASGTVGQGEGLVTGGWDGLRLLVGGPAVEDALGSLRGGEAELGGNDFSAPPPAPPANGGGPDIFQSIDQPVASKQGEPSADPFASPSSMPSDPEPSDDPFASAEAEEATTSIPPLSELSDDAFSGVERLEEPQAEGGELDPLTGDGNLAFAGEAPAAPEDPFAEAGFDQTPQEPSEPEMSMEIEDDEDDDSEVHDAEEVEMFFLPPPAAGATDTNETIAPPEDEPGQTLAPPDSELERLALADEAQESPAQGGTLVPDSGTLVPDGASLIPDSGTLVPETAAGETLAPTDTAFDLGTDEDDDARISIAPEVGKADNLLELTADEASFGFGDEGEGSRSEALENLVENASDAVLDAPEESVDLGVSGSGFMHSGAPQTEEPVEIPDSGDPFGFSTLDEETADTGDGFGFSTMDTAASDHGEDPFDAPAQTKSSMSASDLGYLFDGYVVIRGADRVRFGRRYATRLVDLHEYSGQDLDSAYASFAKDKIAERFVPQTERTMELSSSDDVQPLDLEALHRALS